MENFTVPAGSKKWTLALMGLGAIGLIMMFVFDDSHHHQNSWANLLVNGFFLFGIAAGAMFFYALQYAAEVAWTAQLKRIWEAMYRNIWVYAAILGFVFIAAVAHLNHIYHWMDASLYSEGVIENTIGTEHPEYVLSMDEEVQGAIVNTHYDHIIANKRAFLNPIGWLIRAIVYIGMFIFFARNFRQLSEKEDKGADEGHHKKQYKRSAVFLVFFAVFSSTLSWDWLMSIDPHWFSTLYGWYVFSGMWVTCMIFTVIILWWLKGKGYMPNVNDSHIHDMGKWMFAISMLWSYLWLSQFLLIWYSNIPEEVTYFKERFGHYMVPFMTMFFINFAVPFFMLISRDSKRNKSLSLLVAFVVLASHWVDMYLLVIPGALHGETHFTGAEVLVALGFIGLFVHLTLGALSKRSLVPTGHIFLDESEHHSI